MLTLLISYVQSLGFHVSDGLKYGVDLLLYTEYPSKVHSKYALLLDRNQSLFEIIGIQRVCCSVNKQLIFVKMEDEKVVFYRIRRSTNLNSNLVRSK